jgi:hypothetical protein
LRSSGFRVQRLQISGIRGKRMLKPEVGMRKLDRYGSGQKQEAGRLESREAERPRN